MFIEVSPHKTKSEEPCWRVRVCESSRVNGKPRKRYIRSLGIAHTESEVEAMKRLGAKVRVNPYNCGQFVKANKLTRDTFS